MAVKDSIMQHKGIARVMTGDVLKMMEVAGVKLMGKIKAECDSTEPPHMVEVVLADSDTTAQAEGWPDRGFQAMAVEQLLLALPDAYKNRVRVVSKGG